MYFFQPNLTITDVPNIIKVLLASAYCEEACQRLAKEQGKHDIAVLTAVKQNRPAIKVLLMTK